MRRLAFLLLLTCTRPEGAAGPAWVPAAPRADDPDNPIVARAGEVPIFASDVAAQARFLGVTPKEALDDLVAFELLAFAHRTDALTWAQAEEARRTMVRRFIERDLAPRLTEAAIPEAEVRAVYEKVKLTFVHPRLVEVAALGVWTGDRMKSVPRAEREATARELAAFLAKHPPATLEAFEAVASDPAWKKRAVLHVRTWQGENISEAISEAAGRAVARLRKPGDTSDLAVDSAGAFILRHVSERPAENRSFGAVEAEIRAALLPSWRPRAFAQIVDDLARKHHVTSFPERLARIE